MSRDPNPEDLTPLERSVLERRTRALAQVARSEMVFAVEEVLIVRSGGERLAFQLSAVRSVSMLTRLAPAPFCPREVAGLSLIDAVVHPVFHLHALLGAPLSALPEYSRLLLIGEAERTLALVVERVEDVERLAFSTLRPLPESGGKLAQTALGMTPRGALLLDHERLLADPSTSIDVSPAFAGRLDGSSSDSTKGPPT